MAIRTTATAVKVIMDTTLSDTIVDRFISIASLSVDDVLNGSGLGDSLLAEIECWLAAHLIASTRDRTTETEKVGDASVKYSGLFGKGLEATLYGQMVKTLDTTGAYASSGKRKAYIIATESFD